MITEKQKLLFERLKSMLPPNQKPAGVVMDMLNVTVDTAYRYIRGKTELSFTKLGKICMAFNLSVDEFLYSESEKNILFQYTPISHKDNYININYMNALSDGLHTISRAPEKEFIIAARAIPFIHLVEYPELAFLKAYVWYSALNKDITSFTEFCEIAEKSRFVDFYKKICDCCEKIPSTEIWTSQTIDATLKMPECYHGIGMFNGNEDQFRCIASHAPELIDTVERYAIVGYKGEGNNKTSFTLHLCPVDVEDDFIMIRKDIQWCCIEKRYAINRIFTVNQHICNEILQWVNYLCSISIRISGNTTHKERYQFFNKAKDKVRVFICKIIA